MVYESDFYTTRRPYSRPTITSYSVTRREVPWHKVPTVPRPSQVPPPFTVYGSRHTPVSMDGAVPLDITWLRTLRIVQDVPKSSTPIPMPRKPRNPATTLPLPTPYPAALIRPARRGLPVPPVTVPEATATAVREVPAARMRPADTIPPTAPSQPVDFPTGPTFHRNIPYIAHKRLVMVTPSAHGWRVNKSVLLGEIDRIYHKVRPSLAYQPTEDYLNSRAIVSFDDETRSIRAQTADLLKKIYTPIPRAQRPSPLTGELLKAYAKIKNVTMRHVIFPRYLDNYGSYYSYHELPITDRITSDHYIDRLLSANRDVHNHVLYLSYYDEPARRYAGIGKGHLACVSFAGGRPISRRRNLAAAPHDNIRNDINVLSHYGRFRAAAAAANVHDSDYIPPSYLPPTKSPVTGSWKSNAPQRTGSDRSDRSRDSYKPRELTAGADFDAAMERKKKRREALEAAAMKEMQEEKRHKQREEDITKLAALEKEQEEKKKREEAEQLEAEKRAQEEAERKAKEEDERLRKEEEEKAKEAAKRKAEEEKRRKEEERLAREEAERKAEEERKAREEEERKAREEEERKAREEEERKAKEEEERKAREEEERRVKEEEERKAKEEAERLAREEEERKAKEEAERLAKEEEERLAKEEADRLAKEEEERIAKEEAEKVAEEEPKVEEAAAEEEQPPETIETKEEEPANEETAEPVVEEPTSPEPVPATETQAAKENEEPAEEEAEEE